MYIWCAYIFFITQTRKLQVYKYLINRTFCNVGKVRIGIKLQQYQNVFSPWYFFLLFVWAKPYYKQQKKWKGSTAKLAKLKQVQTKALKEQKIWKKSKMWPRLNKKRIEKEMKKKWKRNEKELKKNWKRN